jgi:hypothetical protein
MRRRRGEKTRQHCRHGHYRRRAEQGPDASDPGAQPRQRHVRREKGHDRAGPAEAGALVFQRRHGEEIQIEGKGHRNVVETYTNEEQRLDQLLAHVTYLRNDLDRGDWKVELMEQRILEPLNGLLNQINGADNHLFDDMRAILKEYARLTTTAGTSNGNSTVTVTKFTMW